MSTTVYILAGFGFAVLVLLAGLGMSFFITLYSRSGRARKTGRGGTRREIIRAGRTDAKSLVESVRLNIYDRELGPKKAEYLPVEWVFWWVTVYEAHLLNDGVDTFFAAQPEENWEPTEAALRTIGANDHADKFADLCATSEEFMQEEDVDRHLADCKRLTRESRALESDVLELLETYLDKNYPWRT